MKLYGRDYLKIHRKYKAATKIKNLTRRNFWYLFYFHTLNINFILRFNPDIKNPSDVC